MVPSRSTTYTVRVTCAPSGETACHARATSSPGSERSRKGARGSPRTPDVPRPPAGFTPNGVIPASRYRAISSFSSRSCRSHIGGGVRRDRTPAAPRPLEHARQKLTAEPSEAGEGERRSGGASGKERGFDHGASCFVLSMVRRARRPEKLHEIHPCPVEHLGARRTSIPWAAPQLPHPLHRHFLAPERAVAHLLAIAVPVRSSAPPQAEGDGPVGDPAPSSSAVAQVPRLDRVESSPFSFSRIPREARSFRCAAETPPAGAVHQFGHGLEGRELLVHVRRTAAPEPAIERLLRVRRAPWPRGRARHAGEPSALPPATAATSSKVSATPCAFSFWTIRSARVVRSPRARMRTPRPWHRPPGDSRARAPPPQGALVENSHPAMTRIPRRSPAAIASGRPASVS